MTKRELDDVKNGDDMKSNGMVLRPVYDSREAGPETVFFALRGMTVDGHEYAGQAYAKGCRDFVLEETLDLPGDAEQTIVPNSRLALAEASARYFGDPSAELTVIGVTGTKGKTSVVSYLQQVLTHLGRCVGTIGTNGVCYGDHREETVNTTPESYELQRILRAMVDAGVDTVCMEASSAGMMMNRVDAIRFDIAVFTNLSEDHVGPKEHPSFENYKKCKARLFTLSPKAIVNIDDLHASEMRSATTLTYGIDHDADYRATKLVSVPPLSESFTFRGREVVVSSPGKFSVYNALVVLACGIELGYELDVLIEGLKEVHVEGRVQRISGLPGVEVLIDFAHNGLSLREVLLALRGQKPNRILVVFGSVGDRVYGRRKELGDVAAKYADVAILTEDDPNWEDPNHIIDEIEVSFKNSACEVYREPQRKKAIELALSLAQEGDIVLITGKGHEKSMLVRGEHIPYDEIGFTREAVQRERLLRES